MITSDQAISLLHQHKLSVRLHPETNGWVVTDSKGRIVDKNPQPDIPTAVEVAVGILTEADNRDVGRRLLDAVRVWDRAEYQIRWRRTGVIHPDTGAEIVEWGVFNAQNQRVGELQENALRALVELYRIANGAVVSGLQSKNGSR